MNRRHALSFASLFVVLTAAGPAMAGTYAKVDQATWQAGATGLPTYVNMYLFTPSTLATKPPILVYAHHCQGDAGSSHSSQSATEKIADTNGFFIIYPEATGQNCWDAGSVRSMKHGGGGDTGAIVQMVKYLITKNGADPNRVYMAGDSSGGIMTEATIGVYPDVFMAGVSIMGVPCGCWADGYNDVTGKTSTGGKTPQWSNNCAGGTTTKTGQAWGDLVRSYFPGYTGHRPRLQHWHGDADTTLKPANINEDVKEWTNVLGLGETPTGTEENTPKSGTTHKFWKNSCYTVYETFVLAGVGHAVSADANLMTKYFGLDKKDGEDPETAACGASAVPGGGAGTGGTGGSTGAGGTTGTGGGGGGGSTGGRGGATDTKTTGTGGSTGGAKTTGATTGTAGAGGASTPGGTTGTGGGKGGSTGVASSSSSASGGASAASSSAKAGSSASSSVASSSGGAGANGSSSGEAGQSGSSTSTTTSSGSSGGCTMGGGSPGSAFVLLALTMLGLALRRQRRS